MVIAQSVLEIRQNFFKKKYKKIWSVLNIGVPLHPLLKKVTKASKVKEERSLTILGRKP